MESTEYLFTLRNAYEAFYQCILWLSDNLFLEAMHGWAPRDVVAHLIGWNGNMITACNQILKGEIPEYYQDAVHDFQHVNAGFVAQYPSLDKYVMLSLLAESFEKFEAYLHGLDPGDFEAEHGVLHHSGDPATVGRVIRSQAGDYDFHRWEIEKWQAG
jgi:Mycothiol maleylpyruvate isomerase N-terminal domain